MYDFYHVVAGVMRCLFRLVVPQGRGENIVCHVCFLKFSVVLSVSLWRTWNRTEWNEIFWNYSECKSRWTLWIIWKVTWGRGAKRCITKLVNFNKHKKSLGLNFTMLGDVFSPEASVGRPGLEEGIRTCTGWIFKFKAWLRVLLPAPESCCNHTFTELRGHSTRSSSFCKLFPGL